MSEALLDTDMLSELLKLRNATVKRHALAYRRRHGAICFSAVTRYEVLRGLKQQAAVRQQLNFETFCQQSLILPVNDAIWDRASDLWAFARQNGFPQNDADLIIAATALEHQRALVTGNQRHFNWIPGINLINWREP